MSRIAEKALKQYYSEISKAIVCTGRQKKVFMSQLQGDIDAYLNENPDATLEEIKNCFGSAETIAQSFILNSDSAEIKRKLDVKKCIVIVLIAALLIYAAFVIISLIDVHNEAHGYMEEGIMVINSILKGGII